MLSTDARFLPPQVIFCAALAYFIFKLVRIYSGDKTYLYAPAQKPLTTFAALSLPLVIATIVISTIVTLNFGKGLKPHLRRSPSDADEEDKHYMNEMAPHPHGPVPSRMVIE